MRFVDFSRHFRHICNQTCQFIHFTSYALTFHVHQPPQFLSIGCANSIIQNQELSGWAALHTNTDFMPPPLQISKISTVLYGTVVCTQHGSTVSENLKYPAIVARRSSRELFQSIYTRRNEREGEGSTFSSQENARKTLNRL